MPAAIRIDEAVVADCAELAALHVHAWQHAYANLLPADYLANLSIAERETAWREMLEAPSAQQLWIARAADTMLGFISFGACRDEDAPAARAEIWALYVAAAHWSTGVGGSLLRRARDHLAAAGYRSVSLWVLDGNERAARFYARAGFVPERDSRQTLDLGGVAVDELRYVRSI